MQNSRKCSCQNTTCTHMIEHVHRALPLTICSKTSNNYTAKRTISPLTCKEPGKRNSSTKTLDRRIHITRIPQILQPRVPNLRIRPVRHRIIRLYPRGLQSHAITPAAAEDEYALTEVDHPASRVHSAQPRVADGVYAAVTSLGN